MASPAGKISVVPDAAAESAGVEARLAGLEQEAARLRAEVAALQDEIRWLTDEDCEAGDPGMLSHGWLARGWVRASLLMSVVAMVALVSVPYLLHLDAAPHDQAREYIPAPARVRAVEIPAPTFVRAEEPPIARRGRAPQRERVGLEAPGMPLGAPAPTRGESP